MDFFYQGFEGDGFSCRPTVGCDVNPAICDPNAICVPSSTSSSDPDTNSSNGTSSTHVCQCKGNNFFGDGLHCDGKLFYHDILLS